jgi:hypothetical protein
MPPPWTVDEANAALPRITAMLERAKAAGTRVRGNGQERPPTEDIRDVAGELGAEGIVLRDVGPGLVDFEAVAPSGRTYFLCWVLGEPEVAWWHWPEDGFAGRTPLSQPPE